MISVPLQYFPLYQRTTLLVFRELVLEIAWWHMMFHVCKILILNRGKLRVFKRLLPLSFDRIKFGWRAHRNDSLVIDEMFVGNECLLIILLGYMAFTSNLFGRCLELLDLLIIVGIDVNRHCLLLHRRLEILSHRDFRLQFALGLYLHLEVRNLLLQSLNTVK